MFKNNMLLKGLLLIALPLLFLTSQSAQAQTYKTGWVEYFTLDTATNTTAVAFTPSRSAQTYDQYTYLWQVTSTNISGTTSGNIIIEESLYDTGNYWAPVDTVAVSAAGNVLISGTLAGVRQRIRYVGGGTQSTQLRVAALFRRKEF